ncbi:hypothetical protein CRUP_000295 [Coryphaenoides rupestris]|nr:hypothetical protein CRUP_000295 [Coryphaenoides rupestris]
MAADLDVVNLFVIAGAMLALPILAFVASFLLWPSALIKVYHWYWRRTLGLQVRYADCGGYRFCYSCRGKPGMRPSILLLHGFSAHKDSWLTVVKFVEAIRLNRKPFHLAGTSMGGSVAGVYAACYPSDICSMTLICPDELQYNQYSLNIPLIPTTPEEMEDMLKLCSHVRFKIPQQMFGSLTMNFMKKVGGLFSRSLPITHISFTLAKIIWGKQDQVVDVSGATVIQEKVPGCRVDLLDNCGHSVAMERPRRTAKLILEFIISKQNTKGTTKKSS